ncbi:MAG: hypothetical protein IK124_04560 [Prevotella sp.]|nr:hypothetical protein [Prevotella sp.]MBR6945888.1 hypothetical protein [Prevotella sp.]
MRFVSTPIQFIDSGTKLLRNIEDRIQMLDNLVELIVFTPRGDFEADLDFGFEYWNHEFSNVHYREFNASQGTKTSSLYNEITKKECEDSIKQSLAAYEPMLKNVTVSIELDAASQRQRRKRRVASKYAVNVIVEGGIDDGLGVLRPYRKVVVFLVEPTVKRQI